MDCHDGTFHNDRQNSSYYCYSHKSIKWWKNIFVSLLDTSVANAYQIYKLKNILMILKMTNMITNSGSLDISRN